MKMWFAYVWGKVYVLKEILKMNNHCMTLNFRRAKGEKFKHCPGLCKKNSRWTPSGNGEVRHMLYAEEACNVS